MEIRTKREFFELWQAGFLGNKLRTWDDLAAWTREGQVLPVGFRQVGTAGGGAFAMCFTAADVARTAAEWRQAGRRFVVCEAAPDNRATIQGEVCRTVGGLHGILGRVLNGKRMRDSMKDGDLVPVSGVQVVDLLNRYMDASSRDDLDGLLELYPDATVEFTCYEVNVGCFAHRNTIFWEVRNY